MKPQLYKLSIDFEPEYTGLKKGIYTRQELQTKLPDSFIWEFLENDFINKAPSRYIYKLIDKKGFSTEIENYELMREYRVANKGMSQIGNVTVGELDSQFNNFDGDKDHSSFYFKEKIFGKNEFIYEEI